MRGTAFKDRTVPKFWPLPAWLDHCNGTMPCIRMPRSSAAIVMACMKTPNVNVGSRHPSASCESSTHQSHHFGGVSPLEATKNSNPLSCCMLTVSTQRFRIEKE
jgi:hypothetical protein